MCSFLIVFFIVFEISQFVRFIKRFDVPNELPEKTDAVVTLAGGRGRIQSGIELCRKFKPKICLLSGVDKTFQEKNYFKTGELDHISKLQVERKSQSTLENALQAEKILRENNIQNILLVTSNYHMYRSFYIFQKIMPYPIHISPYSLSTLNFDIKKWYSNIGSITITFREFIKYQGLSVILFFNR